MRGTTATGALGLAGGLRGVWFNARLALRLLRDDRVPALTKLIVPAAMLYLVWPLDILADLIPVLGQVDDATVLILAVLFFIRSAPRRVVEQHRANLQGRVERGFRVEGDVIEGRYRVIDEERR